MDKPFAITLDPGSSLANKTGSWREERPVYVHRLPPCNHACPAGENIQQWLYHAESGDYEAAWRELVKDNPLAAVMGRVCYHPCETSCNRAQVDDPVGIHGVERFLGDEAIRQGWKLTVDAEADRQARADRRRWTVGPVRRLPPDAPRACRHDPRGRPDGRRHDALRHPQYRLPRDVLDAEVQRILDLGVTLELNSEGHEHPRGDARRRF